MRRMLFISLMLLTSLAMSHPDEPRWEKVLDGMRVECIAPDPSSPAVFAGTITKGLYKGTDHGRRWRRTDKGIHSMAWIYSIAVNPNDPKVIYAATEGGVYRSEDGGENWGKTGMNNTAFTVAINPKNPNIVYAGQYMTENGGRKWEMIGFLVKMSEHPYRIVIDPKRPELLYAAMFSTHGFKSPDSGKRWKRIINDRVWYVAINTVHTNVVYFCGERGVYKSVNGGRTWDLRNRGLPGASVNCLLVDPIDPQVVYAGLRGIGVFKSDDGGGSWRELGRGFSDVGVIFEMTINPSDPNYLYVCTSSGVWRLKLSPRKPYPIGNLGELLAIWGSIKQNR